MPRVGKKKDEKQLLLLVGVFGLFNFSEFFTFF